MSDAAISQPPKAFISYSWSNPSHQAWVIQLATRLRQDGADAIVDKWHLRPGHDALAFMERMVTDPDVRKVLLICDQKYAEKANDRSGGVGTESQIVSPEIYKAAQQDKFVAVISEVDNDGKPYLPAFYSGRLYIDLSNEERFEAQYEELLRWILDRPELVAPPVGRAPAHIVEDSIAAPGTTSAFLRAKKTIENGAATAGGSLRTFLEILPTTLESFRMPSIVRGQEIERDEQVVYAIEQARPVVLQVGELALAVARYDELGRHTEIIGDILEQFLRFTSRPEYVNSWNNWDFDNFKFSAHEVFLVTIASFIKEARFDLCKVLFDRVYLARDEGHSAFKAHGFEAFCQNVESLDSRKRRLKLNRISLQADLLKESHENHRPGFTDLMQADFVAFIRGRLGSTPDEWRNWWPITGLFAAHRYHAFELFARAESQTFLSRTLPMFSVARAAEFKEKLTEIAKAERVPQYDYHRLDILRLSNAENLGTRP